MTLDDLERAHAFASELRTLRAQLEFIERHRPNLKITCSISAVGKGETADFALSFLDLLGIAVARRDRCIHELRSLGVQA